MVALLLLLIDRELELRSLLLAPRTLEPNVILVLVKFGDVLQLADAGDGLLLWLLLPPPSPGKWPRNICWPLARRFMFCRKVLRDSERVCSCGTAVADSGADADAPKTAYGEIGA